MGNCQAIQEDECKETKHESETDTFLHAEDTSGSTGVLSMRMATSGCTGSSLEWMVDMPGNVPRTPSTADRAELTQLPTSPHDEQFYTSFEAAKCEAARSNKPILLLEIRISVDEAVGRDVLSHPLLAEAAESLFVTLHRPPSQENESQETVRVLDDSGIDMLPGVSGELICVASVTSLMVSGLKAMRKTIPQYFLLLEAEEGGKVRITSGGTMHRIDRQAVFGMEDSQLGEVEFGDLDGVLATRAGFMLNQRVIQVTYDSTKLTYCNLTRFAIQRNIADIIYFRTNDERVAALMEVSRVEGKSELIQYIGTIQPSHDPKHALRQTMLRYVPMTDLQATKANRLVSMGVFNEATHILSPRQGIMLMKSIHGSVRKDLKEVVDVPISRAWKNQTDRTQANITPLSLICETKESSDLARAHVTLTNLEERESSRRCSAA